MADQLALEAQHDHLGGTGVAAHPDLGVEPGRREPVTARKYDHPAGMFAAGVVGGVDGVLGFGTVQRAHDQGQHPAHGDHAVALA